MILDMQTMFSGSTAADGSLTGQAITVTAASTNILDTGVNKEKGRGTPIPLLVQVTTTFTAGGAATLQAVLQCDGDVAFGSANTLWDSGAIAVATLVAGYRFLIDKIPEHVAAKADSRYFRFNYTVATGPMTAGNLVAGIVMGRQSIGFP